MVMADEIAVGAAWELSCTVVDSTTTYPLDRPAEFWVYGYDTSGGRTLLQNAEMTQVGSSNTWQAQPTVLTTAGLYEVTVAGLQSATPFVANRTLTVRPKFDPFALANDDVLVARTDGKDTVFTR